MGFAENMIVKIGCVLIEKRSILVQNVFQKELHTGVYSCSSSEKNSGAEVSIVMILGESIAGEICEGALAACFAGVA